jgi:hypothetical protein
LNDNSVAMAVSYIPAILLGETATRTVAHTLKSYSAHTFDYPYPKAVRIAEDQGMEYPMICWNWSS